MGFRCLVLFFLIFSIFFSTFLDITSFFFSFVFFMGSVRMVGWLVGDGRGCLAWVAWRGSYLFLS
jgi:hypothetical protein